MATPLKPHWKQPSHPLIQRVVHTSTSSTEFTTKSYSTVSIPPFGVWATLDFPPCTVAQGGATYATVQMGRERHVDLNSDLVYVNHSCEPSVIFNTTTLTVTAGPRGLSPGDEITFFYPSTEWDMAQGFQCSCETKSCRGWIAGAREMSLKELEGEVGAGSGTWLSEHIRELIAERDGKGVNGVNGANGANGANGVKGVNGVNGVNGTNGVKQVVELNCNGHEHGKAKKVNGVEGLNGEGKGAKRNGVTSRELSGEMGGDTKLE